MGDDEMIPVDAMAKEQKAPLKRIYYRSRGDDKFTGPSTEQAVQQWYRNGFFHGELVFRFGDEDEANSTYTLEELFSLNGRACPFADPVRAKADAHAQSLAMDIDDLRTAMSQALVDAKMDPATLDEMREEIRSLKESVGILEADCCALRSVLDEVVAKEERHSDQIRALEARSAKMEEDAWNKSNADPRSRTQSRGTEKMEEARSLNVSNDELSVPHSSDEAGEDTEEERRPGSVSPPTEDQLRSVSEIMAAPTLTKSRLILRELHGNIEKLLNYDGFGEHEFGDDGIADQQQIRNMTNMMRRAIPKNIERVTHWRVPVKELKCARCRTSGWRSAGALFRHITTGKHTSLPMLRSSVEYLTDVFEACCAGWDSMSSKDAYRLTCDFQTEETALAALW